MASVLARPNLCPAEDGRLATLHLQLSIGAQRQRGLCRAFACFRVIDRPAFPFLRAALEPLQPDQPLQSPVAQCAVGTLPVALVGVCPPGGGVADPSAKAGSATMTSARK